MKKIATGFIVTLFLVVFTFGCAFASIFSDGSILTDLLDQGEFKTDVDVSYSSASDFLDMGVLSPTAEAKWIPLSDAGQSSFTMTNVPLRMDYGVNENFSARVSLPYTSLSSKSKTGSTSSSSGLGNLEVEGLYAILKENEASPSFSTLVKIKLGAGKMYSELSTNEAPIGTRSTDITLAGVLAKKSGASTWKFLLGYTHSMPYKENMSGGSYPAFDIDLTDQIIYSLALSYPFDNQLTVAGELWGAVSLDKEVWSQTVAGNTYKAEFQNSSRGQLVFSPYLSYNLNENFSVKGAADLIVWKPAAVTVNFLDMAKWNTVTLAGTYIM